VLYADLVGTDQAPHTRLSFTRCTARHGQPGLDGPAQKSWARLGLHVGPGPGMILEPKRQAELELTIET
jgi:hypothetical protein